MTAASPKTSLRLPHSPSQSRWGACVVAVFTALAAGCANAPRNEPPRVDAAPSNENLFD